MSDSTLTLSLVNDSGDDLVQQNLSPAASSWTTAPVSSLPKDGTLTATLDLTTHPTSDVEIGFTNSNSPGSLPWALNLTISEGKVSANGTYVSVSSGTSLEVQGKFESQL